MSKIKTTLKEPKRTRDECADEAARHLAHAVMWAIAAIREGADFDRDRFIKAANACWDEVISGLSN